MFDHQAYPDWQFSTCQAPAPLTYDFPGGGIITEMVQLLIVTATNGKHHVILVTDCWNLETETFLREMIDACL